MPHSLRGKTDPATVLKARLVRSQMTVCEGILWDALRDGRLNGMKFRRQHPFGPFVLDFFCVKSQLAIELDGNIHDQPGQVDYDRERTTYLEEHGLHVLRFRNKEVIEKMDEVLQKILKAASPTSTPPLLTIRQEKGGNAVGRGG